MEQVVERARSALGDWEAKAVKPGNGTMAGRRQSGTGECKSCVGRNKANKTGRSANTQKLGCRQKSMKCGKLDAGN